MNEIRWYFLNGNNEVVGPLSTTGLKGLVLSGEISSETPVCEEGTESWRPFSDASGTLSQPSIHSGHPTVVKLPELAPQTPLFVAPSPLLTRSVTQPTVPVAAPKVRMWIYGTGLIGFVLCAFIGRDRPTGNPIEDILLNAIGGGLAATLIAAYLAAIVISGMKGKPFCMIMGIAALGMPGVSLWPIVGAIRIAKPNSR